MKKAVILLWLFLGISTFAQTSVIRGIENPGQIPDTIAYRLYFFVLTNEAQEDNLAALHLSPEDRKAVISVLRDFKSLDEQTRSDHVRRDSLVDEARAILRDSLSIKGMAALDSAVLGNKSNITLTRGQVSPEEKSSLYSYSGPCGAPDITWYPSVAQITVYTTTQSSVISNSVYDGYASYNVRWYPQGCTPHAFNPPVYTPQVYNVQNGQGGWKTGASVVGGNEFNVGSVITYGIVLGAQVQYQTAYGQALGGSESSYGETFQIIEPIILSFQLEVAYEKSSNFGAETGCVRYSDLSEHCYIPQIPFCTKATMLPDLDVSQVFTEVWPTPAPEYFKNYGACVRSAGGAWHCAAAISFGTTDSDLDACTHNP